jgi:sulfonate transport system permease protein
MPGSDVSLTKPREPRVADAQSPTLAHLKRRPGAADRDPGRYTRRRRAIGLTLGIVFPVALLALWQVAAVNGWISRLNFPAPTDIASEMRASFQDNPQGNYWEDVGVSVRRMLYGYGYGVAAGLFLGFTMGMSWLLRATLEPTLTALYTVPKIALIGVFLIVFGFKDGPIVAIIAITVFFFVWIQTMEGVGQVPDSYLEAARSFHSNPWQTFRHVILPATLPQIFVGLRVAAGVAVLTMIGVEFVYSGTHGIGYRIQLARQTFDPKQAYVGLVTSALLGVTFTWVIKAIGWLAMPWLRGERQAGGL